MLRIRTFLRVFRSLHEMHLTSAMHALRVVCVAAFATLLSCADTELTAPTQQRPIVVADVSVNAAPSTAFAISPRYPAPGDTVTLDGTYSHDADGQVTSYQWSFGNGSVQTTGAVARTVYSRAGNYPVTLTTVDDSGGTATVTLSLVVNNAGAPATAVSASASSLTLSAANANAGTGVTATATVRSATNALLDNVPVSVSAQGRAILVLPSNALTNVIGEATAVVASTVAQTVRVRAVADFTAITSTVSLAILPSLVSATRSAIRLTKSTLTTALDSALVEVTVRDTAGNPVSNSLVSLANSIAAGATLPSASFTDANGRWIGVVRAGALCAGNSSVLSATAGGAAITPTVTLTGSGVSTYGVCGVTFWVDGSDTSTTTLGGANAVSQWRDKSGRGQHVSNPVAGQQPISTPSLIHGRRALRFDGDDQLDSGNDLLRGVHRAVEVFAVAAPDSTKAAFLFVSAESLERFSAHLLWPDGRVYWDFGSCCDSTSRSSAFEGYFSPAFRASVWSFGSMPNTSPGRHIRRDGATLTTNVATDSLKLVNRGLSLGTDWRGNFGEMLIIPRLLSSVERRTIEHALMAKWGIGTLTRSAGNSQSAGAGTSPTIAPQVRITDDSGAPIAGAPVTFQVTSGSGRVNGGAQLTVVTDASGYAIVPAGQWVIDADTNTLTAWYNTTIGAGTNVVFSATGTLPSGLALRLDASDTTSLLRSSNCTGAIATNAQGVGCWLDKSGNAANAMQTILGDEPVVNSAGIGGRRTLGFTLARENWLDVPSASIRNLRSAATTIVAVARATSTENSTDNSASAIAVWQGYHNGMMLYGHPTAYYLGNEHWARDNGGPRSGASIGGIVSGTPFVGSAITSFSSATEWESHSFLNGSASAPSTATDPNPGGVSSFHIGQGNVAPSPDYRYRLDGEIGEVLLFSRALTTVERQRVERYLGWKWGVLVQ